MQIQTTERLRNELSKILFVISLVLLTSCAITPPDVPLCTELSPVSGYCVNTMSSKGFDVNDSQKLNGKTWWQARPYMIYMPIESWVELKAFIIKICKKSNKCSGRNIGNWTRTVDLIDENLAN